MDCCIIMPAYEPGEEMLEYLKVLSQKKMGEVIVVDDGSGPDYRFIFEQAGQVAGCHVLTHEKNHGKGAALKTAFRYYIDNFAGCAGVVTVDCDGQHALQDVVKICGVLQRGEKTLVLGCRDFGEGAPQRSAIGNKLTSGVMSLLYGIKLKDTQTGLRGIPDALVPAFAALAGERYEYELNMLIYAKQHCIPFTVVPIQTIYFDNNAKSHYRTVPDSLRIIGRLCRGAVQYILNALLSGGVDLLLYVLLVRVAFVSMPTAQRLFLAALVARVVSSAVNYLFSRQLPFVQNKKIFPTVVRYYLLWSVQLSVSFGAVWAMHTFFGMSEIIAKIIVDILLGILSYQVQMRWVFHAGRRRPLYQEQKN